MSVFHNNALIGASGQGAAAGAGYEIERSLRFNSADTPSLTRAITTGKTTWTLSLWVKRTNLSNYHCIFSSGSSGVNATGFFFNTSDGTFYAYGDGNNYYSTEVYRDFSAWYHIVISVSSNSGTVYVNGQSVTISPSLVFTTLYSNAVLGTYGTSGLYYFDGYMADVHFIDGQALSATDFGELDDNNVWQPIAYAGTYGTDGAHLDFSDNSSASALGTDSSGNGNNFTVSNLSVTCGNGSYVSNTTGTPYSAGAAINAFDDDDATYMLGNAANSFYGVTFSPGLTGTLRLYASRSTSSDGRLKVNGTEYTSSLPTGFASPSWVTISYPEASITSIEVDRYAPLRKVEVDGVVLVDNAAPATAGCDSLFDSPTNGTQTDTGAGGEVSGGYCTLNPLWNGGHILSNGNLNYAPPSPAAWRSVLSTFGMSSGKWYWEQTYISGSANCMAGFGNTSSTLTLYPNNSNSTGYDFVDGYIYGAGAGAGVNGATLSAGDTMGISVDVDAGEAKFYKNGVLQLTLSHGITGTLFPLVSSYDGVGCVNFGQRPYAYSAPSGFQPLCTALLPDPTIADGSTAMDVVTYSGNSSNQTISGLAFSPDAVWIKNRSDTTDHFLANTVAGAGYFLYPNLTNAENYDILYKLQAFNSDGFDLGGNGQVNGSGYSYVGWCWDGGSSTVANTDGSISSSVRANASAGFSIVSYTGTNTNNATVGHGLGVAPELIIIKNRDASENWMVIHKYMVTSGSPWDQVHLKLNTTNLVSYANGTFNGTAPTSSVLTLSNITNPSPNYGTAKRIAYCWAPVEGYSAFGSYTGNGSTNGPFVYTGHRTRWLMVKRTDSSGSWWMWDTERDTYNLSDAVLRADNAAAENTYSGLTDVDILSNGFKWRGNGADVNASGGSYIFMSFAENPFKYARAQ